MSPPDRRDLAQLILATVAALLAPHGWHATVFCALYVLAPDRSEAKS